MEEVTMLQAFTHGARRRTILAWPILALALALALPALATPSYAHPGKGKGKGKGHKNEKVRVVFVPVQQTRIREYFVVHRRDIPAYYYNDDFDDLPPGIRRQLILNGTLPPGLEDRIRPFPVGLDEVLGPPMPGYRRVIIGRNAYLVDTATNVIVDILTNAITR
jgi:hypothetical protein